MADAKPEPHQESERMPDSKAERNEPQGVIALPEVAPNEHSYIEDGETLVKFLDTFGDPADCVCAVDTEADSPGKSGHLGRACLLGLERNCN